MKPRPTDVWTSSWTRVDGLEMHARVAAAHDRRAVVLVHGLLVSSRYMTPLADELKDRFDVWAPDMPGFGLSDDPREVPDVPGLARWLGRWIEERDLQDVTLVANSFGCQYAAQYVADNPSRVRALVLTGPTMDPARRTALRQAARWLANAPVERLSLGGVIARDLVDCGVRRLALTYRHALRDAIEDNLPRIEVPTVVVRGERDPLVTQRWAEEAAALLPAGRLEIIEKAAHTVNYNSPDRVAPIVRDLG